MVDLRWKVDGMKCGPGSEMNECLEEPEIEEGRIGGETVIVSIQ